MPSYTAELDWINTQRESMLLLLQEWANINSGSDNLSGLAKMMEALIPRFAVLHGTIQEIDLPPRTGIDEYGKTIAIPHGKALSVIKRPDAPIKVFLGGHMDTVYSASSPFQNTTLLDNHTLQGPGVADMKGGLVVMLKALEALERHPLSTNIGWEILINPDEEVGSSGSQKLLIQSAKRNHLGLIFEPSLPDGAFVDFRTGSANMTVTAFGRSAHAGRDFHQGRNAIAALAQFIVAANTLIDQERGITLNFGHISGGGAVNIVPDIALCRLNIRTVHPNDFAYIEGELMKIVESLQGDGISFKLFLQHMRPPKRFDEKHRHLFNQMSECAKEENIEFVHRASGGACDGNILSAHGLPVIDSLGVQGNHIHTSDEWMAVDSLTERARLTALFLLKLASSEFQ